jgi:hypothetical protein
MRIGIIEIKTLVTVRETFTLRWRIGVGLIFLIIVCFWWGAIYKPQGFEGIVTDDELRPYTLALVSFIVLGFAIVLFRKGTLSRTLFLLAAGFISLNLFLLLILAIVEMTRMRNGLGIALALGGLLLGLWLCWKILIRRMYALCQSLIPIARWRAYRQQVNNSLRLWSGQWKGLDAPSEDGASEERVRRRSARLSLATAGVAFVIGLLGGVSALIGLINIDFPQAIYDRDFSKAWDILRNLQIKPPAESWATEGGNFLRLLPFMFAGIFGFGISGYCWVRWKRGKILIHPAPLSEHMTPSTLLLLRSFDDDIMFVPGQSTSILKLPLKIYGWSFTFEQLINERLTCVGEIRLLAREEKEASENEDAEESKNTAPARKFSDKVKSAMKGRLDGIQNAMKISDLPPMGGTRHQANKDKWKKEIEKSIPVARMIIVLFGVTENLQWEIDEIEARGLFRKTVFLMPPLDNLKSRYQRWEEFVTRYLCETEVCKTELLKRVNPKRILAVCFHDNELVLITGELTQLPYESALDVATILTLAAPTRSGEMVPKYLDIAAR